MSSQRVYNTRPARPAMHGIIRAHVTAIPLVLTAQLIMSAAFVPKTAPCCIAQSTDFQFLLLDNQISLPARYFHLLQIPPQTQQWISSSLHLSRRATSSTAAVIHHILASKFSFPDAFAAHLPISTTLNIPRHALIYFITKTRSSLIFFSLVGPQATHYQFFRNLLSSIILQI